MITLNDIEFSETCCNKHAFFAEKIRKDGIGFAIERNGEEETYTVEKYASDGKTKLETKTALNTQELLNYLNKA